MSEKSGRRSLFWFASILVITAGCTGGVVSQAPDNERPGVGVASSSDADCQGNAKFQRVGLRSSSDVTQAIGVVVSFSSLGPNQALDPQQPIVTAKLVDPYQDGKIVYAGGTISINGVKVPATVENVGPLTSLQPEPPQVPPVYSVRFTAPISVLCSTQVPAAGVTLTLRAKDGGGDSFDPANVQCKSGSEVKVTLTRNWKGSPQNQAVESKQIDLNLVSGQDSCNLRVELNQ